MVGLFNLMSYTKNKVVRSAIRGREIKYSLPKLSSHLNFGVRLLKLFDIDVINEEVCNL